MIPWLDRLLTRLVARVNRLDTLKRAEQAEYQVACLESVLQNVRQEVLTQRRGQAVLAFAGELDAGAPEWWEAERAALLEALRVFAASVVVPQLPTWRHQDPSPHYEVPAHAYVALYAWQLRAGSHEAPPLDRVRGPLALLTYGVPLTYEGTPVYAPTTPREED